MRHSTHRVHTQTASGVPIMSNSKMFSNMPTNLDGQVKKLRFVRNCLFAIILCMFALIPLSVILFQAFIIMGIAVAVWFICLFVLMAILIKTSQIDVVLRLRNQITAFDVVEIADLLTPTIRKIDMIMLIKQLISSGNLQGYTLVDNEKVVKNDTYNDEAMAMASDRREDSNGANSTSSEYDSFNSCEGTTLTSSFEDIVYCSNCSNKITTADKFCSKCGSQNNKYKY